MRSHEKRANMCPQAKSKYLVSVVLTAVFAIASLFGALLFSADAVADAAESQAVAQVGNATYASVQEAIGRTTLKNTTVTLLADVTESVTITPSKGVRSVTFDLNGHALQAAESGGAAGFAAITVPANSLPLSARERLLVEAALRSTAVAHCAWKVARSLQMRR